MILHGARIGFFQGDIRLLSDDLNTLKPTVFPVVPRLLNRMYDKVGVARLRDAAAPLNPVNVQDVTVNAFLHSM